MHFCRLESIAVEGVGWCAELWVGGGASAETLLVIQDSVGFLTDFEGSEGRMPSSIRWLMASPSNTKSSGSASGLVLGTSELSRDWGRGKVGARSMRVSEARMGSLGEDSRCSRQAGQTKAPWPGKPGVSRVERHFAHTGCACDGWSRGSGSWTTTRG